MASNQPSFAGIGRIITRIAKLENSAIIFAVIASLIFLGGMILTPVMIFAIWADVVFAVLIIIVFIRIQLATRALMNALETIGSSNNIPQFSKFARFLFNAIAVGFVGFIWAIICAVIMATPYVFTATIPRYANNPDAINASLAGEITLVIVSIIIGLAFIPHAYKAWKYIDDYFVILHDPWPREIGLAGVKKISDSCKVALVTTFMAVPALAGYTVAAYMLWFITINVLVASGKYIQGLNRVGEAFVRVQTIPLYATAAAQSIYRPPAGTTSPSPQTVPPPILRYQPSQTIYSGRPATPSPVPVDSVTRDLLARSNAFIQIVNDDPAARRNRGASPQTMPAATLSPTPSSAPAPAATPNAAPQPRYTGKRCKYCLAELPANVPAKCPSCDGVLLDISVNQQPYQ
jgi:hypothetical protein